MPVFGTESEGRLELVGFEASRMHYNWEGLGAVESSVRVPRP